MSHDHGHDHHRGHPHDPHPHDHRDHNHPGQSRWSRLWHAVGPHSHAHDRAVDPVLESSAAGLRALWISLAALGVTACAQFAVVALSGSVALLGDALHNTADALTAVPLGVAFLLGRRRPNRRYTYGYGRAEDLAGVVIVAVILLSSAVAAVAAFRRAAAPAAGHPPDRGRDRRRARLRRERTGRPLPDQDRPPDRLGGAGRRWPARPHRRVYLAGRAGRRRRVAIGWRWADPAVGLLITVAILSVGWQAAREVGRRLMDSVDPALTDQAEATLRATPGVLAAGPVRLRWVGHAMRAECEISVDPACSVIQAHDVAVQAEHALIHAIPRLAAATVHADPLDGTDHHILLADHTGLADHAGLPDHASLTSAV